MNQLKQEYKQSLKLVRELQIRLEPNHEDTTVLGRMASDLQYTIDWLNTGRRPGNKRGIERRAAYQRTQPIDPIHIQNYVSNPTGVGNCSVTEDDRQRIEDALSQLSRLEKEVYLMARGQALSHSDIAELMGISIGTVKKSLARADKKVLNRRETSLFCQPKAT